MIALNGAKILMKQIQMIHKDAVILKDGLLVCLTVQYTRAVHNIHMTMMALTRTSISISTQVSSSNLKTMVIGSQVNGQSLTWEAHTVSMMILRETTEVILAPDGMMQIQQAVVFMIPLILQLLCSVAYACPINALSK